MKLSAWKLCACGVLGVMLQLHAAEVPDTLTGDEWVAAHSKIAEEQFHLWQNTHKEQEEFYSHAVRGERADLIERVFSNDKLAETEIHAPKPAVACKVIVRDRMPAISECGGAGSSYQTIWRRITKDRFEIWTPKEGRLYDVKGKLLATAKVHRGDGWGREWYGAFLPDGSWVTTDIDARDDTLAMFSSKGKRIRSIKGGKLIPQDNNPDAYPSLPLIAWARSSRDGKAWVVSVGSEFGRGWVKVKPDGKWTKVSCPWKECFPQQLGPRGMVSTAMSDDGEITIIRHEPSHGPYVGWPVYEFPGGETVRIPGGEKFGILAHGGTVFIEAKHHQFFSSTGTPLEELMKERVWYFDKKGKFDHWIIGHSAGAGLAAGGLWVVQPDDTCLRVDKDFSIRYHFNFVTEENQKLTPVEIYDDIGLVLFLSGKELVLGTCAKAKVTK